MCVSTTASLFPHKRASYNIPDMVFARGVMDAALNVLRSEFLVLY